MGQPGSRRLKPKERQAGEGLARDLETLLGDSERGRVKTLEKNSNLGGKGI